MVLRSNCGTPSIKNGKREIGLLKNPGSHEILKPKQDGREKEIHQSNEGVEIRNKDWGKSFDEANIQNGLPINLRIVMIDFSHVFQTNGQRDEGHLFEIKNLEKHLNLIDL
ncbi:unnamed protein product [Caenorhabditis nigoni]